MVAQLPPDAAREVVGLWTEYEAHETPTAVFVGKLDKLEMCVQAREYEAERGFDPASVLPSLPDGLAPPLDAVAAALAPAK